MFHSIFFVDSSKSSAWNISMLFKFIQTFSNHIHFCPDIVLSSSH